MRFARIATLAVALTFIAAPAAPVLAGPPAGRDHGGPPPGRAAEPAAKDDTKGDKGDAAKGKDAAQDKKASQNKKDVTGDAKQVAKPKDGDAKGGKSGARSNKGGELRGLDRADQVAGEHGKEGRDNARAKQER